MEIEADEVTTQVRVVELETTESNTRPVQAIVVVERVDGPKGATRHFTQVVSINDAELSRRILAEVHEGDEIIATILDEWGEQGCGTYLTDFKKVPDINQKPSVKNGTINIVHNDITQLTIPPARHPKTKVRQ